jgi:hypothetical protein
MIVSLQQLAAAAACVDLTSHWLSSRLLINLVIFKLNYLNEKYTRVRLSHGIYLHTWSNGNNFHSLYLKWFLNIHTYTFSANVRSKATKFQRKIHQKYVRLPQFLLPHLVYLIFSLFRFIAFAYFISFAKWVEYYLVQDRCNLLNLSRSFFKTQRKLIWKCTIKHSHTTHWHNFTWQLTWIC